MIRSEKTYWIDGIRIDPKGLVISGAAGERSVEPKVMDVLTLMAESPGQTILRDRFMDQVWGVEYGSDESLTRAISLLRKHFSDLCGRRAVIETVPRKGYRLVGQVSNIEPSEASGISSANEAEEKSGSTLWAAILSPPKIISSAAALLIMTALIMVRSNSAMAPDEPHVTPKNSVNVQTFSVTSGGVPAESLASDLASQITAILTERGITTTFDQTEKMPSELELSGDVWSLNAEPRATIRLKHQKSGLIIWSEILDRTDNPSPDFAFGVAVRVGSVMNCLSQWRQSDYVNAAKTLQLYARYCAAYEARTYKDLSAFTEPIYQAEPDNPVAMALHANSLRMRSIEFRFDQISHSRNLRQDAAELVNQALEAAPDSDLVNAMWGLIRQYDTDAAVIDARLAEATAISGLPEIVYLGYGDILRRTGRVRDTVGIYERLIRSNPYNAAALARLGWLYATQGDFRQSERHFQLAENINPNTQELLARRRQVELWLKDDASVTALLNDWPVLPSEDTSQLETCLKIFAEEKISPTPDSSRILRSRPDDEIVWVARMLVGLGEVDEAYDVIDEHDWDGHPSYTIHLFYPDMEPFRADPRFWNLVEDIGLVQYWTETGHWPDFCEYEEHGGYCPQGRDG